MGELESLSWGPRSWKDSRAALTNLRRAQQEAARYSGGTRDDQIVSNVVIKLAECHLAAVTAEENNQPLDPTLTESRP
jgi:hypothetical protein